MLQSGEPAWVSCDADKLSRVLANLLSNAIKFTPEGGEVVLSVEPSQTSVAVSVKDTGIGIPSSLMNKLFNMFAEAKRKGTRGERSFGIGLSVCKRILDEHKTELIINSKEGVGSVFSFQLQTV